MTTVWKVTWGMCLLFCALATQAGTIDEDNLRFTSGERGGGIPFTLKNSRLAVQVRVNNSAPLWFALDTGASVCVIDEKVAVALGLPPGKTAMAETPGGKTQVTLLSAVTFALPGIEWRDPTTVQLSLSKIALSPGEALDGVLGNALFQKATSPGSSRRPARPRSARS